MVGVQGLSPARDGDKNRGRREWLLLRAPGASETRIDIAASPARIGRTSTNEIPLRDDFASASHAELIEHAGKRCVRDLGSKNGTHLNGRQLAPDVLQPLKDGDVLQVGSCELTYRVAPEQDRRGGLFGMFAGAGTRLDDAPTNKVARKQPAVAPRPARRYWWRRAGRLLLRPILAVAVAAAVLTGVLWVLAPARVSVLVLGTDARPDEIQRGFAGRTDTLLTVVADRSPADAVMISLPRDLWVQIPGLGEMRINTAYPVGGPDAAKRAVSDVLGVRADRYLVIGLQGVRDVVDAVGGVEIDVPVPIHDDAYPTDDYGTIVIDIPAGRQRMDGETALRYVRTRHQDNDFGRIARQQQLVAAVRNALLRPTAWPRIPAVIGAIRNATATDLGPLELVTLGWAFVGSPDQPERLVVGHGLVEEFTGRDGASLLRPTPALRERVAAILDPTKAAVEVLNGTGADGLAKQTADTLRSRGMRVARFGDAGRSHPETTIEVVPGFRRAGSRVASILNLSRDIVRESTALPTGLDVRITLGGKQP